MVIPIPTMIVPNRTILLASEPVEGETTLASLVSVFAIAVYFLQ